MPATFIEDKPLIEERQATLFQTAAWEQAWQETWGQQLANSPATRLDQQHSCYHATHRLKGLLPITTTTAIGCSAPGVPSIRREYFRARIEQIQTQLDATKDQCQFNDVVLDSPTDHRIRSLAKQQSLLLIEQDPAIAYSVNTGTNDYTAYLAQLSANTRLKLHNRRKRLHDSGTVNHTDIWPDIDGFIEQLNHFHQQRWGKPCYQGTNLAFIQRLLPLLKEEGHKVGLHCMAVDGQAVSLLLDIEIDSRIYNLQSGYEEQFRPGLSLGTLHFGYRLEQAFELPHIQAYDFMAGEGKNSNYKAALATQSCQLITLLAIKPRWLKLLYRLKNSRA